MTSIIIIEDDRLILEPLARALTNVGYHVATAGDGQSGLALVLRDKPDLVLLDIMLPKMSGWDVCKAIREQSVVPILMLTALNEEVDRILGLELGADDYLTKPFSTRELLARVKAMLRRVEFDRIPPNINSVYQYNAIAIDLQHRTVTKDGQLMNLRYKEFELLSLLVNHAGEIVTRATIFDKVWGTEWLGDMRTLDVHIRWLREKLEDDPSNPQFIQTVRGVGYRLAIEN